MSMHRTVQLSYLSAALFLLGTGLCPATAQLLGPELQINTYTTGSQRRPAVAADGSGTFVVVWLSYLQDGSGSGVFGQRYDSAGSPTGSEFQINTYTTNDQRNLAVAADGSGKFVVAWESSGQDGSGEGIFGQRFNSAGSPVGSEFQVNAFTTSSQRRPAVAADLSGSFVVAWGSYGQDGSGYGVFGQRFDSAGSPVGSELQVNTYTTSSQSNPAVSADGSGSFVVAWQSCADQDGSSFGVFGQRYDSAGSPVGSELQINTYTTDFQGSPTVAADGSGNFVVAWESYPQDGSNTGIFGQRFNSAGSPVGSEFQVNSHTTGYQGGPEVAVGSAGSFVVAWTSYGQDGPSSGVLGQRFNSAGSPLGSEFQVNTYTTADQQYPAVAADGSGNFVVAWESEGQDGSSYGVFGRQMTVVIFSDDFEVGDVCAWSAAVGSGDVCPP